jgi:GBP family porin
MKKTLMSLAILAASGAAYAQSNVTIYGIMDAGLVGEQGGKNGTVNKVSSGGLSASRLGFKGTEDLGGGLSAVFTLETGIKGDTGELDNTTNQLFNRQAFVGLSSKTAGSLTLGRQYTPWYNALSQVGDPFAAGTEGSAKNLFPASGANVRNSNSVVYKSPEWNGVSGELFYGAGEQKGEQVGRQLGASIGYQNGPLNVRAAFNTRNGGASATKVFEPGRNALIAANYDFKVAKAFAMFGINRGTNSAPFPNDTAYTNVAMTPSTDNRIWLVGATVPVSAAGTVVGSWTQVKDHSGRNADAKQAAIGYLHSLSKRTTAYASFARVGNHGGASYTVGNNADVGTGHEGYGVGIRHMF